MTTQQMLKVLEGDDPKAILAVLAQCYADDLREKRKHPQWSGAPMAKARPRRCGTLAEKLESQGVELECDKKK